MSSNFYNKDYGLISLDALAAYYNEVLGEKFIVKADCIPIPPDSDRTACTLHATRVPFAIADVRSETLTVSFNFRIKCSPESCRKTALDEIKRLLGYQRFVIQEAIVLKEITNSELTDRTAVKTFNCTSFLELQQSLGVPEIDSGCKMLDMQVTGTILVSDMDGGAVMSNDIVTFAKLAGSDDAPVALPIVYSSTNEGFNVENQVGFGEHEQTPVPMTSQASLTVQALYLDRGFERNLLVGLKKKEFSQIELTDVYDTDLTVKRVYNVLSFSEAKQAGAYMQYTLELQAFSTEVEEE